MKNILLVLVGGTICTAVNSEGTLSVSEDAAAMLIERFKNSSSAYRAQVKFTVTKNLFILSENMTVKKWNIIIDTYREYIKNKSYDGVVFAHGTDTLAYSSALFSLLLSDTKIPVFFVSSNARLDLSIANGNDNFCFAVESICRGIPENVYVPYKNISDGKMYLHLASRLEQCKNYSDDFFSSGAIDVSEINEKNYKEYFDKIKKLYPCEKRITSVDINEKWKLKNSVLKITPYVGLCYTAFNYKGFDAVLHGTFHAGTACCEDGEYSILTMANLCTEAGTDVYISPSKTEGEIYDTVRIIEKHSSKGKKIKFLYGCTNEMCYVKLVLAYSLFEDKAEIESFISKEYNFERIDR